MCDKLKIYVFKFVVIKFWPAIQFMGLTNFSPAALLVFVPYFHTFWYLKELAPPGLNPVSAPVLKWFK